MLTFTYIKYKKQDLKVIKYPKEYGSEVLKTDVS